MGCCGAESDNKVDTLPKKYEQNFKGPIQKGRSCTDIICCASYLFAVIIFWIIGLFAWLNGNPVLLVKPTDSNGNLCGLQNSPYENRSYLLYFDITECLNPTNALSFQCPTRQICVESCPTQLTAPYAIAEASVSPLISLDASSLVCMDGVDPTNTSQWNSENYQDLFSQELCAPYTFPSSSILGRCIPALNFTSEDANTTLTVIDETFSTVEIKTSNGESITYNEIVEALKGVSEYLNVQDWLQQVLADIDVSWPWVLGALGAAAVISFLWIVLLRFIAGPIIWTIILGIVGLVAYGIYACYVNWDNLVKYGGDTSELSVTDVGFTTDLSAYLQLQETWLAMLIIACIIEGIVILMVIFLRKRIQIAIEVLAQASKALGSMMSALFFPLITWAMLFITTVYYLMVVVFLASSFYPAYKTISLTQQPTSTDPEIGGDCTPDSFNSTNPDLACVFLDYGGDSWIHRNQTWVQIITLALFLWCANFLLALQEMTLAGAFASYYWAWRKPQDIPHLPVTSSFARSLRYHTGTLAFGSLIITIVQLARIALEYVDSKVRDSQNKVARFIMCCLRCCLYCLEKFLRFLNRNAYVVTAIYGKSFCPAAREAFMLLLRNVVRVFVLDKTVDFCLFLGKLLVTIGISALSWAFLSGNITLGNVVAPDVSNFWYLIILIGVGTYFISSGFFGVYAMAVDTTFICFCEDLERNNGQDKPYFMSKSLLKVLGKKNKTVKLK